MAFVTKLEEQGKTRSSFHKPRTQMQKENYYQTQFDIVSDYLTKLEALGLAHSYRRVFNESVRHAQELISDFNLEKHSLFIDILNKIHEKWDSDDKRSPLVVTYPCEVVIMVIILCFMSGKHSLNDVVLYWILHNPELQVLIPNMPSADNIISVETVRTMIKLADEETLENFFIEYFSGIDVKLNLDDYNDKDETDPQKIFRPTVAFDGQEVRSSYRRGEYSRKKKAAIGVSVYDCDNKLVKGFTTTEAKSTEDRAFISLLPRLSLKDDCIICADAINMRAAILNVLNEKLINFLLPVKGNMKTLLRPIQDAFSKTNTKKSKQLTLTKAVSGRIEVRTFTLIPAVDLPGESIFSKVKSLVKYETSSQKVLKRNVDGAKEPTHSVKYYISTLEPTSDNLEQIAHSIGVYWSIEQHHNTLDTVMMQDYMNICDKKHAHARIGFNKIIYNVLSLYRQRVFLHSGKKFSFRAIMDYDCACPFDAFELLSTYWLLKAPKPLESPKRTPSILKFED